jgi:rhamnogalacturonyl hydrolase YesR
MYRKVKESFNKLFDYCKTQEFKGYDPYDGLNSGLFQSLPFVRKNRLARLIWIQLFKRSPVNLRTVTGIRKEYNPKALGLFLSGYCALYKTEAREEYLTKIKFFSRQIEEASVPGFSGACWGYNFDWESRAFFQPKNTPTIVVSSFIANSLLDAYEIIRDEKLLNIARSTCDFILTDLNRTYSENGNFAFSYSKVDNSVVFNATLLGSRLLARVYSFTGEKKLIEESKKSVDYCCEFQKPDGSWTYGTYPFHQWIDSFHTGYNLECISAYMQFSGDYSYKNNLQEGFDYYIKTFFTSEGIPKYYNNSIYPIDIHAPAQLIITLSKLGKFHENKKLADNVLNYTINHMQSSKGYFYYQINKYFTSKIPYMRWSQAWMFYAMSYYLLETSEGTHEKQG